MPDVSFSIRIIDEDGCAQEGVSVFVCEVGLFPYSENQYTDIDGWVYFTFDSIISDSVSVNISIGVDLLIEDYTFEDGDSASFTYSPGFFG